MSSFTELGKLTGQFFDATRNPQKQGLSRRAATVGGVLVTLLSNCGTSPQRENHHVQQQTPLAEKPQPLEQTIQQQLKEVHVLLEEANLPIIHYTNTQDDKIADVRILSGVFSDTITQTKVCLEIFLADTPPNPNDKENQDISLEWINHQEAGIIQYSPLKQTFTGIRTTDPKQIAFTKAVIWNDPQQEVYAPLVGGDNDMNPQKMQQFAELLPRLTFDSDATQTMLEGFIKRSPYNPTLVFETKQPLLKLTTLSIPYKQVSL